MEQETIATAITDVVSEAPDKVKASKIIEEVLKRKDTSEDTVRQELIKLKQKKVLVSAGHGYYRLKKEDEEEKGGRLVHLRTKRKPDPAKRPAIILRRDDGSVWANVHMTLSVDVVNPIDYRVSGLKLDVEADFKRGEAE